MKRLILSLSVGLACSIGCAPGESGSPIAEPAKAAFAPSHAPARKTATPAVSDRNVLVHNGKTMHVRSVVAVLDPADSALRFELLPFEPTDDDVARCLADETFFMTYDKDSPDPEAFPDRVPYATYALNWFGDTSEFGNPAEGFNALHAHFIGAEGSNLSLSFGPTHHTFSIEGEIKAGSKVRLIASGEDTLGDDAISWNLDVQVPIRMAASAD